MDRTSFFKACVKAIRTRNKGNNSPNVPTSKDSSSSHILGKHRAKTKTEFGSKASEVKNSVSKLRNFLLKHRKDYIDAVSHSSVSTPMGDHERDQIDNDAEIFIRTCSNAIKSLHNEVANQKNNEQVSEHRKVVLRSLERYLKAACKIYSEQRAIRVKRVVDKKRISRLQRENRQQYRNSHDTSGSKFIEADLHNETSNDDQIDLTMEEIQTFEQENKLIFDEMNSLVNEVRNIEGRVVEIAKLQEVFSEKVLEQSKQIDHVYETTVTTTENVKDGNENIREAIKNNASFRVWILFFLVMCSFSLLFLDWYS